MHAQPTPKLLGHCFTLLEALAKQAKIDLDKAVDLVLTSKGVKASDFWRELETGAHVSNELRFYHELLVPQSSSKPLQVVLSSRKQILATKQVTNYPGLSMDKVFLSLDEWSAVVTRLFSGYAQPGQSLVKFQAALDHLCKSHAPLKVVKENISRISLTTLLECIYLHACSADRSLDSKGKHIVEQTLMDRAASSQTTNLGLISKKHAVPKAETSDLNQTKGSSATTPLKLATAYVARVESPQTKTKDPIIEASKADYTAYHKILQRKAELAAELKALEAKHAVETEKTIDQVAEVMALAKVQKTTDNDFLAVSKDYLAFMRRKIAASGRKAVNSHDFQNFQQLAELHSKMTSSKREQEISIRITEELGEGFRKFMRNHFAPLKKAEQEYIKKMNEARERANQRAKGNQYQSLGGEEEASLSGHKSPQSEPHRLQEEEHQSEEEALQEEGGYEEHEESEIVDHPGAEEELNIECDNGSQEESRYCYRGRGMFESMQGLEETSQEEYNPYNEEKQVHKFSDIPHPEGLLESDIEEDAYRHKRTNFGASSDDRFHKNENGWDSAEEMMKDDEDDSIAYAVDKDKLWESEAVQEDEVADQPNSILVGVQTRKRMATEPPLPTVFAESLVQGDTSRSQYSKMTRGMSASDALGNDRESIVKRVAIPKLYTGSQSEIKVTDMTDEIEPDGLQRNSLEVSP